MPVDPANLKVPTLWYGTVAVPHLAPLELPALAYHPAFKGRSLDAEANILLKRYGRQESRGGRMTAHPLPPTHRFSRLKLWGHRKDGAFTFEIRERHPVADTLPGRLVFDGLFRPLGDDRLGFVAWMSLIDQTQTVALTLLDDDLHPRTDKALLYIEWFNLRMAP